MNKFAIILGEPRSINSEILAKSNAVKRESTIVKIKEKKQDTNKAIK